MIINDSTNLSINREDYEKLPRNKHQNLAETLMADDRSFYTARSSVKGIHIVRNPASESHELYTHESFDIIYACRGNVSLSVCGNIVELDKPSLIFIAPKVPYRIVSEDDSETPAIIMDRSFVIAYFHRICQFNSVLSKFFANAMWAETSAEYLMFNSSNEDSIHTLINLLISEEIKPTANSEVIKAQLLLCLCGYLSEQPANSYELSPGKITRSEQINKILAYIQDNYRTVTLEKLAETFHYTVPYVSKLIRSATGLTFTDILREIKFDICRSLLTNSDLKINKIAEVAGFQNTDHFNRIFKKRMGETPSEYRKNLTGMGIDK